MGSQALRMNLNTLLRHDVFNRRSSLRDEKTRLGESCDAMVDYANHPPLWQRPTTNPNGHYRVQQRRALVLLKFPSCCMRSANELPSAGRLPLRVPICRSSNQSTNRTSLGARYPSAPVEHMARTWSIVPSHFLVQPKNPSSNCDRSYC